MGENLTIEEILKQAEEIRNKTAKKASQAIEEIKSTDAPLESIVSKGNINSKDIGTKTTVIDHVTEKTTMMPEKMSEKPIQMEKTRAVDVSEKTGVVENLHKGKKSFFKHEHSGEIYSKEPPEIIEKPATIRSKSKFDKTSDLQEIPMILAVEELQHTRIMGNMAEQDISKALTDVNEETEDNAQIRLEGFDDHIEEVPDIDEELAEKILLERRKDKVNKFRLFAPEGMGDENTGKRFVKSGFRNNEEKTVVLERLFSQKSVIQIGLSCTVILGLLLLLLTLFQDTSYLPTFLLSHEGYYVTAIVLFALILVVNINNIIHAFNFKHGINYDLPIALSSVLVMAHMILLLVNPDLLIDGSAVFASALSFAFFMSSMGKRALLVRVIENFEFITDGSEKHTVETIQNIVDATIISRGLLQGEPILKSSVRTDFPSDFLEIGCSNEPADRISSKTGLAMMLLNALLFGVLAYVTQNWYLAFYTAVCGVCISLPAVSLYATNLALLGVSRSLAENNALVNGFEGAQTMEDANALVLEAHDLFGIRSCDLHGIKTFNGAKIDDAILQTAAVVIKTKSPLTHVFDDVIVGKQSILPEVDGLVYEDKMGTSGWIYKKKILVGNRKLLIHHGISVPKEEYEQKYTRKGRKALYLAVAGKIMAMFIVSYSADPELKKSLIKLEKTGMTILLRSCDPFIDEESIVELFEVPEGFVRVMNASSGRVFEKYSDMHVGKSPAHVVHDGSAKGFISAMQGAESLIETKGMLSVLIAFGSAIGFGVVMLLAIVGGYNQMTPQNVLIFQGVWSLFVLLLTKLKRISI